MRTGVLAMLLLPALARAATPAEAARVLGELGAPPAGATARDLEAAALLAVTVNPEGRVKVARGPGTLVLTAGRPGYAVVAVENQSGGRPRLRPLGTHAGGPSPFALELVRRGALTDELSGQRLEYLVLRVECRTPGRRELTVGFEAGQGTQDLGFRGEAPVLFDVRPAE